MQPIQIKDLKGTKSYDILKSAYDKGQAIPQLTPSISKLYDDVPESPGWDQIFEDTTVYVERVIAYWSRSLKAAERNYSPTEREAMALKDGLIKFQPFIEGERIIAVTDHAALIWSKTFQNVNRRLLSWGTVFSAYPDLQIVHRAGRVHSNVDLASYPGFQIRFHARRTLKSPRHESSTESLGQFAAFTAHTVTVTPRGSAKIHGPLGIR